MTRRIVVDPLHPDPTAIAEAAVLLRAGGLVAFPTETVYGIGAHALDPSAVRRIYKAKGRPAFNPLIVHVATAGAARELVSEWPARAERLAARFWPGPLTMVLPKIDSIPDEVTAGLPSVGVRVPAHPVALALLREAGIPVAAPSANRSTEVSPTTAEHVLRGLDGRVDLLLDGGATQVGIESTVLDLTGSHPRLLRPGMISVAQLEEIVGSVELRGSEPEGDAPRTSPGQLERHYAPRASLELLTTGDLARRLASLEEEDRVGVIAVSPVNIHRWIHVRQLPMDPVAYAKALYAELHLLDAMQVTAILVERPPDDPAWAAVHDRLRRAAHA